MKTDLRQNRLYFIVYKTCMFFMFRLVVPLLVLIHVNIKLMVTLRNASKDRARLTKAQNSSASGPLTRKQQNSKKDYFTTILVSVVSVFIMCQFPDFVVRTAVTIKSFTSLKFDLHYFNTITNMLLTLNSSINCLVYCLTGHRFRRILIRQLCKPFVITRHQHMAMDDTTYSHDAKHTTMYVQETTI